MSFKKIAVSMKGIKFTPGHLETEKPDQDQFRTIRFHKLVTPGIELATSSTITHSVNSCATEIVLFVFTIAY